jgi:hypothetical protein
MRSILILLITLLSCNIFELNANSQTAKPQSARQQIAAAVLPLPEVMRKDATVMGYAVDMSLVTLRKGSNGMVCTAPYPEEKDFDVRCYHESFMPLLLRIRELYSEGVRDPDLSKTIDAEIKAKKLTIPDHPIAGYRMLGPMSAYHPDTNTVDQAIDSWQSIHFPYKTAAEIGLPEEGQVKPPMPYVMASGTYWSHVMIEHGNVPHQK